MPQNQAYGRIAWVDRFNKPTVEQLRAALPAEPAGALFDALRSRLRQLPDVTEDPCWFGDCWFWTIAYRTPLVGATTKTTGPTAGAASASIGGGNAAGTSAGPLGGGGGSAGAAAAGSGGEPLVVIIPSPDDLQVAMPFERELSSKLASARMKRTVREGFELAADPFDTRWGVWSITYPTLVDDLLQLVKARIKFLTKPE